MKKFVLICFLLFFVKAAGQTPKTIENDLLRLFKKINNNSPDIGKANEDFENKLAYYAKQYPITINQPFESLKKENLNILTSDDGLLRIYSWDTWTGGTMHYFENFFQYKLGDKTKTLLNSSKAVIDEPPNYHTLYTFPVMGKAYYLSVWRRIGSTQDATAGITCFIIKDGKLQRVKIIKTASGLHDELSYWYNFFSVADIDFNSRPGISFDEVSKTISLPLVNTKGGVTSKFIHYKFNGKYFERKNN